MREWSVHTSRPGVWIGAIITAFVAAAGVPRVSAQPVPLPPLSPAAQAAGAVVTREPGPGGGFEFVTIGNQGGAGNTEVPTEYQSFPTPTPGLGRVDYEYRISRTELTYGQYFDFVRAYAPYWSASNTLEFLGIGIRLTGADPHDPASYTLRPGWGNAPANMGWRYAARFCNWLHNDRGMTLDAFQTGAYDATTFSPDPPFNVLSDNTTRLPGARFFLPTQNEWTKASFYDPNRFGPGMEGYWQYPTSSDLMPVIGVPGSPGAQASTGLGFTNPPYPIVSYSGTMSPWGLLDAAGGAREWLEGRPDGDSISRFSRGQSQFSGSIFDERIQITFGGRTDVDNPLIGLRIGATVPTPPAVLILLFVIPYFNRRCR